MSLATAQKAALMLRVGDSARFDGQEWTIVMVDRRLGIAGLRRDGQYVEVEAPAEYVRSALP